MPSSSSAEDGENGEAQRVGAPSEPPANFSQTELKEIDLGLYLGEQAGLWRPPDARGVYGGQIIGQALNAALRTVPAEKKVHSLHAYFIMKGDDKHNIVYRVMNVRDGKSFSMRSVTASQQGTIILVLMASFQVGHNLTRSPVIEHQFKMPIVPKPESLLTLEGYYASLIADPRCPAKWKPLLERRAKQRSLMDVRPVIVSDMFIQFGPAPKQDKPTWPELATEVPRQAMWMKVKQPLPDDPTIHCAVLAYASDMGLLGTAKFNAATPDIAVIASLDHAMWFHAPFRADDWLLYVLQSPRATDGRGLSHGAIYSKDGTLVVTVAQEGVIRLKAKRKPNRL